MNDYGHFLGEEDYRAKLDAAIAEFQARVATPWRWAPSGEVQLIYELMRVHEPAPVTRGELVRELRPDYARLDKRAKGWVEHHLHSRLKYLLAHGFIYECGRVVHPYFAAAKRHRPHATLPSTMSYRVVLSPTVERFAQARSSLYRKVAALNCRRELSRQWLEQTVGRSAREDIMLGLRAQGLTLREIGERFGLTRERVRQILERAHIASQGDFLSGETA